MFQSREASLAAPSVKGNVKNTENEPSSLFDEEQGRMSPFDSEKSAVSSTAAKTQPIVQPKRKSNQISLFDDNDDDDDDGDDLFASIAPSNSLA